MDRVLDKFIKFDPSFKDIPSNVSINQFLRMMSNIPELCTYEYLEFLGEHLSNAPSRQYELRPFFIAILRTDVQLGPQFLHRFGHVGEMDIYLTNWQVDESDKYEIHISRFPISWAKPHRSRFIPPPDDFSPKAIQWKLHCYESLEKGWREIIKTALTYYNCGEQQRTMIKTLPLPQILPSILNDVQRHLCYGDVDLPENWAANYLHLGRMPQRVIRAVIMKFHGLERVYLIGAILSQHYAILRPLINDPEVVEFFHHLQFFAYGDRSCTLIKLRGKPQITLQNFLYIYRNYYGAEIVNFLKYLLYDLPEHAFDILRDDHVIHPKAIEIDRANLPISEKMRIYHANSQLTILRDDVCRHLSNSYYYGAPAACHIDKVDNHRKLYEHRETMQMVYLLLAFSDGYYESIGGPYGSAKLARALHLIKQFSSDMIVKIGRWSLNSSVPFNAADYDKMLRQMGEYAFFFHLTKKDSATNRHG